MQAPPYVALSIATVPVPGSSDGQHPAEQQLVAIGLMVSAVVDGRWAFVRRAEAIGAGERDEHLLDWLAREMPSDGTVIGWQLDWHLMPVLIEAATSAGTSTAIACMAKIAKIMRAGTIDLALDHGGASAPPLVDVAADMAIAAALTTPEERMSAWAVGDTGRLRVDAADDALAAWRLFLRFAGTSGLNAEASTEEWIRRRKAVQAVSRG